MKLKGKAIREPNCVILVIPRPTEDIVFKMQAVLDMTPFDDLCPRPKAPQILKRGIGKVDDVDNPNYLKAMTQWAEKRVAWLVIQSIKGTEELEWEQVIDDNPDTWLSYENELKASGFSATEIMRITNAAMEANSLNDAKIQEARNRFLLGQEEATQQSLISPGIEQNSTPSSALASDIMSDHRA